MQLYYSQIADVLPSFRIQEKKFLNNDKNQPITYFKSSVWLKYFGLFSPMYACITRFIMNHVSINKYKLRFFPK